MWGEVFRPVLDTTCPTPHPPPPGGGSTLQQGGCKVGVWRSQAGGQHPGRHPVNVLWRPQSYASISSTDSTPGWGVATAPWHDWMVGCGRWGTGCQYLVVERRPRRDMTNEEDGGAKHWSSFHGKSCVLVHTYYACPGGHNINKQTTSTRDHL